MSLRFARRFSRLKVWGALAGLVLAGATAFAYIQYISATGDVRLRWFTTRVDYAINEVGTEDIPGEQEFDAVRAGFQTWEDVDSSFLTFGGGELTTSGFWLLDGENVVIFEDDPFYGMFGILGYTIVVYWLFDGEIIEADISINDYFDWSLTEETDLEAIPDPWWGYRFEGVVNLPDVITHEIGHFCGLGHTFVDDVDPTGDPIQLQDRFAATMYPYVENVEGEKVGRGMRSLELDDEAGLSHIYPNLNFVTDLGVISGRLTNAVRPGEPVFGAHMIALSADEPYYEAVSAPTFGQGQYLIDGLPPGRYIVFAEPMQALSAVGSFFEDAELNFIPEYFALDAEGFETDVFVPGQATVIDVAAGEVVNGIDYDVFVGFGEGDPNEDPPLVTNDRFRTATLISEEDEILGVIDPANDVDFYRFSGDRGDVVGIEVIAQRIGSRLQPRLSLFDREGGQPVKVSEDFPGLEGDARIVFELPKGGTYYVKVEDRRGALGGEAYVYILKLEVLSRLRPVVAKSDPQSVLDIPMGVPPSAHSVLEEMTIQFIDKGEDRDFGLSDLMPIIPSSGLPQDAGIAVYDDSGLLGNGVFNFDPNNPSASDKPLPLLPDDGYRVTPILDGFQVTFYFQDVPRARVPQSPDDLPDFYVVVRTSEDFNVGDDFQAVIPPEGIVVRDKDTGNRVTFFPESFPTHSDTYVSDPIRLVNFGDTEQRIDVSSRPPVALIGVDGQAPAAEEVVISSLTLTVIGFNHRLIPGAVYGAIADVTSASADYRFESADLAPPQTSYETDPEVNQPGGVSLFRDSEDPRGESGLLDPTTDYLLAVTDAGGGAIIADVPTEDIPADFIWDLIPVVVQEDPYYQLWLEGIDVNMVLGTIDFIGRERTVEDLIRTFGIRAFKFRVPVALPEDNEEVARRALLPADNVSMNLGPDFFVAVSTSERIRALDSFIAYVAQDDVEIKTNLGRGLQRPIPSLARITSRTRPEHVNLTVCRPRPRVQITDLARYNRVIKERGGDSSSQPKAVFGINASDFGQNFNIVPLPGSAWEVWSDVACYFNQTPIIDAISVRLLGSATPAFDPNILQVQGQFAYLDNELGLLDHGVSIWVDDDTPLGDFDDNDGDGLIDEELLNLIDDDLDGVIDEEDWGDDDGVGTNGVFDDRIDNPLPFFLNQRTQILINSNAFFNNDVGVITEPGGSRIIRIPLLQTRRNEIPIGPRILNIFTDPMTFGLTYIFVRPDHLPIWYGPSPSTNICPVVSQVNGGHWNFGFYMDCRDLDDLFDLFDLEYTYSFPMNIPDEDRDFFAGDDYFVVLRTGPGAEVNDEFRIQIPEDGIEYSVYQNASVNRNNAYPGTAPDSDFGGQTVLIVGHQNVRPSISIIDPGTGENYWVEDHLYTVRWVDEDPDDNAVINLFLTDQRGSLARVHVNPDTPIFEDDIQDRFVIDIADPDLAQALSDAGIYPVDEFDTLFVVAEIADLAHEVVVDISQGPIRLNPARFQPFVRLITPATGEVWYFDRQLKFDAIRWEDRVSQSREPDAIVNLFFNFLPQLAGAIPITMGQGIPAVLDKRYPATGVEDATNPSIPGIDEFVFDLTLQDLLTVGLEVNDLVNRPIYIVVELNDGLREPVFDVSDGFILLNPDTLVGVLRYEKLLNTGSIVPSFGAPQFPTPELVKSLGVLRFFRDMEINPEETGAVVTNDFGMTVISGAPGVFADRVSTSLSTFLIYTLRDLAPDFDQNSEAVVDVEVDWQDPGVVFLATDLERVVSDPPTDLQSDPGNFSRSDAIYQGLRVVDMEFIPPDEQHPDGSLVRLRANGEFEWLPTDEPAVFPDDAYGGYGTDDRIDLVLNPDRTGGIVLTKSGEMIVVPDGSISESLQNAIDAEVEGGGLVKDGAWLPDEPEDLQARNAEITREGTALIVMDSEGKVYAFNDPALDPADPSFVRLPPDRDFSRGFQDLELLAQGEEDVLDLIKTALRAYRNEDPATLLQLTHGSYRDVHGRDVGMLSTSLRTIFDFYAMHSYGLAGDATPCVSNYSISLATDAVNPQIVVRSEDATATVYVCQAASLLQSLTVDVGSEADAGLTEVTIPFTQTATIFEAGDGRGDSFEIYDLDNPSEELDIFYDRRIFEYVFLNEAAEGPWFKNLRYEGLSQNNTYVLRVQQDGRFPLLEPPQIVFMYYPASAVVARAMFPNEYTFLRNPLGTGFLLTGLQTLIDLPGDPGVELANAGRMGFSFQKAGPVVTLWGDEADFVYRAPPLVDITAVAFAPPLGGVVDISQRLGFFSLDRFRYNELGERLPWESDDPDEPTTMKFIEEFLSDAWVGDLSAADFVGSEPAIIGHVYLVRLSRDSNRFGLVQPIAFSIGASRILVDWFYVDELRVSDWQ